MLSPQSIERFRELYLEEFGIVLSLEEAAEQAQRLLNLMRIVRRPMPIQFLPRYKELLEERKIYVETGR